MKLISMLLLALLLLTACAPASTFAPGKSNFFYMEIDGMTCLYFRDGIAQAATAGITCNWAEWNGERDLVIKSLQP